MVGYRAFVLIILYIIFKCFIWYVLEKSVTLHPVELKSHFILTFI